VESEQLGDDLGLELPAAREPAREHRRHRPGRGRPDEVPLGADRALLGDIAALRWYTRRVVATAHRPMVGGTLARSPGPVRAGRSNHNCAETSQITPVNVVRPPAGRPVVFNGRQPTASLLSGGFAANYRRRNDNSGWHRDIGCECLFSAAGELQSRGAIIDRFCVFRWPDQQFRLPLWK
jgi:hypothetical protein